MKKMPIIPEAEYLAAEQRIFARQSLYTARVTMHHAAQYIADRWRLLKTSERYRLNEIMTSVYSRSWEGK